MKINVVVVEDEPEIRNRVKSTLEKSANCHFLGAFGSGEEALTGIPELKPQVILMDIFLGGMTGIEVISILKPKMPETQFLVCTVMEDNESIFNALKAGATGYILKKTPQSGIISAIEELHKGGSPMSLEIARRVISSFQPSKSVTSGLSKRETEVLELLAQGFRYKHIAEKLFISPDTVNSHIRKIYEKLQVNSKVEAIIKFRNK